MGEETGKRLDVRGDHGELGVVYKWRGRFSNAEANALHAEAFETRLFDESEWDWEALTRQHSLGWVTARLIGADISIGSLVGFVNVLWDGFTHAWLQDVMVALSARHQGVGVGLVQRARSGAVEAKCEWLHVDFDDHLRGFYFDACGFTPTSAGLMDLT